MNQTHIRIATALGQRTVIAPRLSQQSFNYINQPHGWIKKVEKVDVDGQRQIYYVNNAHRAVHEFLSARLARPTSCEYKYFISQRCWGFSFPIPPEKPPGPFHASFAFENAQIQDAIADRYNNHAYLLFQDTVAGLTRREPVRPEEAPIRLELADPAFYDKLTAHLANYGLGQAEEKVE